MTEDWGLLASFPAGNWRGLAIDRRALKGLRRDESAENLLRVLFIRLGCGQSLHESAVRARNAHLVELSSVALCKRLKESKDWLRPLCIEVFRERGVELSEGGGFQVRVTAAMTANEQGETGSLLRMHYSVRLSSLAHDFLADRDEGAGHGRILRPFPDPIGRLLAGRPGGVRRRPESATWRMREVKSQRECTQIRIAQESLGNEAPRAGKQLQPQTSEFAKYVIVFTTFLAADFADSDVLMSEGLAEPRRHWLAH